MGGGYVRVWAVGWDGMGWVGLIIFVSGFLLRGWRVGDFFMFFVRLYMMANHRGRKRHVVLECTLLTPAISDTHAHRNNIFHLHLSVYPFYPPSFKHPPPLLLFQPCNFFSPPKRKSQTQILNTPSQMQHTQTPALIPSPMKEKNPSTTKTERVPQQWWTPKRMYVHEWFKTSSSNEGNGPVAVNLFLMP